jgi:hypothetical protein
MALFAGEITGESRNHRHTGGTRDETAPVVHRSDRGQLIEALRDDKTAIDEVLIQALLAVPLELHLLIDVRQFNKSDLIFLADARKAAGESIERQEFTPLTGDNMVIPRWLGQARTINRIPHCSIPLKN